MASLRRIAIAVGVALVILSVFWMAGGKSWIRGLISTEDWARFTVPPNLVPIQAEFRVTREAITVCNRDSEPWSHLLVQIDRGYLAELDGLDRGACKEIPIEKFAKPSWKRLPAYKGLQVTRVEVLATLSRSGYARHDFPPDRTQGMNLH